MKRLGFVAVVVLMLAVAAPAVAGGKHKCTASADDCLNKMSAKYQKTAWLGIETEETKGGHRAVSRVFEGSPAEKAGFKKGDILLALNGVEMTDENKDALKKVKHSLTAGSHATYVVKRQGGKVKLEAELGSVPREVMAQWIGDHMLDGHAEMKLASK
jgi:carboxyl-terminal processing protease